MIYEREIVYFDDIWLKKWPDSNGIAGVAAMQEKGRVIYFLFVSKYRS